MALMACLGRTMLHGNAETLVLAILAARPCHRYEIRKELAPRSNEHCQFVFGWLYPLLQSLERRCLVTTRQTKSALRRDCKQYTLTAAGASAQRTRKQRWHQFVAAMDLVFSGA